MNRRFFLSAALLTAGIGGYVAVNRGGQGQMPALVGMAEAQSEEVDTSLVSEMTLGNPDAPVTVVEYASFTCPHCANFHSGAFKQLKEEFIDTGRINFVYREVYFDRFGLWAAMIARCAGPDRYFGVADVLYQTQREWTAGGDPATIADNLRRIGLTAGLSPDEVNACLQDGDKARAMVAVYQENAEADGINSTPSFVINGEKYSNMPYDEMKAILEEALG
jgi:protein-disulfide isomerase